MKSRSPHQFSLLEASASHPSLARLLAQQKESQARLQAIASLLPAGLRNSVKCGPFEAGAWCLLLRNNTTAAKLRQLLPLLEEKLKASQLEVTSIRLKVSQEQTSIFDRDKK